MRLLRSIAALLAALSVVPVAAQPVLQATVTSAQAQVKINRGVYEACGVRVIVFHPGEDFPIRAVDYSFSFYLLDGDRGPAGMAKYAASTFPSLKSLQAKQPQELYVLEGWLKPQGPGDLPPDGKTARGDNPNTMLTLLEAAPLLEFLLEIAGGPRKALVGVKARGDKVVWVLAHSIQLEPDDAQTFAACMSGLTERTQKWLSDRVKAR